MGWNVTKKIQKLVMYGEISPVNGFSSQIWIAVHDRATNHAKMK